MTNTLSVKPKVAGIILAAGQSLRMGKANKLLTKLDGKSFVRRVADSAIAADLDEIIVVTGHERKRIEEDLSGLSLGFTHNKNFADGLSTSLTAGIETLGAHIDAALILLADMPFVTEDIIRKIVTFYDSDHEERIIIPSCKGQRGNPVLWPKCYFGELVTLRGDQGARQLFKTYAQAIHIVELGKEVLFDIDTPEESATITTRKEKPKNDA